MEEGHSTTIHREAEVGRNLSPRAFLQVGCLTCGVEQVETLRAKLEEEQKRSSAIQIELDAQRQVNADIMMQIEDQSELFRTVHAEVPASRNKVFFLTPALCIPLSLSVDPARTLQVRCLAVSFAIQHFCAMANKYSFTRSDACTS